MKHGWKQTAVVHILQLRIYPSNQPVTSNMENCHHIYTSSELRNLTGSLKAMQSVTKKKGKSVSWGLFQTRLLDHPARLKDDVKAVSSALKSDVKGYSHKFLWT